MASVCGKGVGEGLHSFMSTVRLPPFGVWANLTTFGLEPNSQNEGKVWHPL